MNTVPPPHQYHIDPEYPFYTIEEIVGSYLGHNPYFPSQADWLEQRDAATGDGSDGDSDYDDGC